MEYTHTHTHIYRHTHEQNQNNPTKINYSRLTWQTQEMKKYIPVKNKTKAQQKTKLKQGVRWETKQ